MKNLKVIKSMRGDTIVEVLIAMAVLALMLGGAYYTAGLNYRNVRDSQEHTEAVALAEGQIEDIRIMDPAKLSTLGAGECVPSSLIPTASCSVNSDGSGCIVGGGNYCYSESVTPCTLLPPSICSDPSPISLSSLGIAATVPLHTYQIEVSWQSLNGYMDRVTLYYRVDD